MAEQQIRFEDGAAYEEMMGKWSRLAGDVFLNWLAPPAGWRWIDVGCGNGAFTELIVEKCAPAEIQGIDPSDGQLKYARTRHTAGIAQFKQGDAMALPYPAASFDAAVMALVIFFVPDPAKGVAEMVRVVRPGGMVSAYAWDIIGGGFPLEPIRAELRAMGYKPPWPPSVAAAEMDNLRLLWTGAGLAGVETREITVERTFASFDEFWTACINGSATMKPVLAAMPEADLRSLKERVGARLQGSVAGRVTYSGRANAIKGSVPK